MLMVEGSEIVLIDTGIAGSEKIIWDYIRSFGRDPKEISMVVLTHSHPDHIGSAARIKEMTGCVVLAHGSDKDWIEDVERQKRERPIPGFDELVAGPVHVDHVLHDGDGIDLGGLKGMIVHSPGHSPGSISINMPMENVLITGDAVPIPGDIPIYDDALAQMRTLDRLMKIDDVDLMVSAWDVPKKGREVRDAMRAGKDVVKRMHRSVLDHSGGSVDPELIKMVLKDMGLPTNVPNALIARTIGSHMRYRDETELMS